MEPTELMDCPYCQSPLREDSPSCPRCGLTMEKAGAYFGAAPRMVHGVSDSAGVLTARDIRRLRRRIAIFERRFPQTGFTVTFMTLGKDTPGATYAWWVFNRCHPGGEMNQGGDNRHLFLLVDTASRGAWLLAGYGLEPFIGTEQLGRCLEKAHPYFAREQYAAAVAALLVEAEVVFREVVAALPRMFGLEKIERGQPVPSAEAAAAW